MTDIQWHGLRVAHQQSDNRDLIVGAVGPFLTDVAPVTRRAYYLPHWRRGPHVRIFVDCGDDVFRTEVLPAEQRILRAYVVAHPSRGTLRAEDLLDQHRQLAVLEEELGPLLPWYADNSVAAEDFPSRAASLGSVEAAELLADFYVAATPLALRMAAITDQRVLFAAAFDQLIATAEAGTPSGLSRGFVAFRSHAEAYLSMAPEGRFLRSNWERQYQQAAEQFRIRADRVVATVAAPADSTSRVTEWLAVLSDLAAPIADLVGRNRIRLADTDAADGGALATVTAVSPFHQLLQDQQWWRDGFAGADWFKSYRVLLNFGYLQLTRVGINPVQRFLLCYLASRAAEDLYGVSAAELISGRSVNVVAGESR